MQAGQSGGTEIEEEKRGRELEMKEGESEKATKGRRRSRVDKDGRLKIGGEVAENLKIGGEVAEKEEERK